MDSILEQLVDYTCGFSLAAVPEAAREAALRHIVDAIVVSIAGYNTESARIAVRVARTISAPRNATILGAQTGIALPVSLSASELGLVGAIVAIGVILATIPAALAYRVPVASALRG